MNAEHEIIALERQALDRWCRGDPSGFLEISAPEVVYFDPFLQKRPDGWENLQRYYEGLRSKISAERFELIDAKVQEGTELAVLTFNFISWGGSENELRWNCTEVFRRMVAGWRIIQTHWSFTKPVLM
jgi:ketosteroid isomerase-like protein